MIMEMHCMNAHLETWFQLTCIRTEGLNLPTLSSLVVMLLFHNQRCRDRTWCIVCAAAM
jgi:hypothetical protein